MTKSGKCVGANRYLLRLTETDPTKLRRFDSQLVAVEEAFKNLQGDLHRLNTRIEAHIFVAFLADCPHVSLGRRLRKLALGMDLAPCGGAVRCRADDRCARTDNRWTRVGS